ncbi:MAG: hypothetical protein U5L98_17350 [Halomonas sp.]|uniref:hypothetical protein n=1 Tax=Halomonas sp. TaxID=1486246 RepID=UPI002ACE7B41|nr:hypothetical protein [Halomonas sp.]MDZ7854341.1 hypothetical protein [Halomonas sp.]
MRLGGSPAPCRRPAPSAAGWSRSPPPARCWRWPAGIPDQRVVFFAAGFETTTAPIAALFSRTDLPDNLLLLLSARQTWPAIAHLLEDGTAGFDALIAPGHVATIMGAEQWRFVAETHGLPTAVAGFTPGLILAGLHAVLLQALATGPRGSTTPTRSVSPPAATAGHRR